MSYDYQLEKHLQAAPPEPAVPACLDSSLRVSEWEEYYPAVRVGASFFSQSPAADVPPQLVAEILAEHSKSAAFRESKTSELEERLADCEQRLAKLPPPPPSAPGGEAGAEQQKAAVLNSILEDVEQVNLELCLLEKFTATCRDCLELHINQVSSQAVAPFSAEVDDVFDRVRGDKKRVSAFVERLSKVYDDLRSGGTKEKAEAKVGTSFVRKSIKYWVHPDNLTEVKCHVLRHLPIFAFPNKDGSPHNPAITSVYYDNSNLDLYTGRLLKQDEAIALRIRWYGVPEQPVVYVENKIHYEDWTGEPSTKSRFAIAEKDVNAFMAGTRTLDDRIKELTASGAVPRKEIEAMDKLAKQVQKAVKERELVPTMRTFYNRTAFQLPDSARVRLSLDEDLTFVREDDNVVGRKLPGGGSDKNWRRQDVGIEWPFDQLPPNEVHHFPYAVMEVKLQTEAGKEAPLWARELMQSQLVEEAPKFSKFVHGCVSLLEPLTPFYPYWLYQMTTDVRHRRRLTLLELTRTTVDVPWEAPLPCATPPKAATGKKQSAESIAERTPLRRQTVVLEETGAKRHSFLQNLGKSFFPAAVSPAVYPAAGGAEFKEKEAWRAPEKEAGHAPASDSQPPPPARLPPAGAPLTYLPPKGRKLMVPTVVEPKVHFANERTFLGWTHYALFLINGGAAIIAFTSGNPRMNALRGAAVVIVALGTLFMFIGLYVREARQKKIEWNPNQERIDTLVPLFIILGTITFAAAINWFAVFYY